MLDKTIHDNVSEDATMVVTDDYTAYKWAMGPTLKPKHRTINHREGEVHTNTVENAFSLFKRGIAGNFDKVSIRHLHRYLSEFDRSNRRDDGEQRREWLVLYRCLTPI